MVLCKIPLGEGAREGAILHQFHARNHERFPLQLQFPEALPRKVALFRRYIGAASARNIVNVCGERPDRLPLIPKYKEKAGIEGGRLAPQANTLHRKFRIQ